MDDHFYHYEVKLAIAYDYAYKDVVSFEIITYILSYQN